MAELKEVQKTGTESPAKQGKTTIAEEVVAKIVALAVKEIEGVHELGSLGIGEALTGLAQRVAKSGQSTPGVSVEVGEKEVAADVKIVVEYNVSIPQVAAAIRRNISNRVHTMTGLTVKEVNIDVVNLYFPEETTPAEPKPSTPTQPRVQ